MLLSETGSVARTHLSVPSCNLVLQTFISQSQPSTKRTIAHIRRVIKARKSHRQTGAGIESLASLQAECNCVGA